MKKLISILSIIILFASQACANTISADVMKNDIHKLIMENLSQKTSAELDVRISMLPFNALTIPEGDVSYKLLNPQDDIKLVSRDIKRVNMYVGEKLYRSLSVPIEIKAYDEVLVAAESIHREQPITLSKVRFKKINISDKSNFVVTKSMMKKDMVTKKEFRDGEYIDKRFLRVKPDVIKNSSIRILLTTGTGFEIAIDGIARMDGIIGDYITVENKTYNKTYHAKVINPNTVLVHI